MPEPTPLPFGGELLPRDGSAVLRPGFLPEDEADEALRELHRIEPWEEHVLTMFGREVSEPRRSVWHSDPGFTYTYSGRRRESHDWNPVLARLKTRCENFVGARFNGVLVNLYRNGIDHMGWHADDEANLGPAPVIASISLGTDRRFEFRHRDSRETVKVVLPHGSLLLMSGATQDRWVHRLPRQSGVVDARINLTFRHLLWGS